MKKILLLLCVLILFTSCAANTVQDNSNKEGTGVVSNSHILKNCYDLKGHTFIYNNGDIKTTLDFFEDEENGEIKVIWEWNVDSQVFEGVLDAKNSRIIWDEGTEATLEIVNDKLLLKEKTDEEEFKYMLKMKN